MMNMRMYRQRDTSRPTANVHNIYLTARGEGLRTIQQARSKLETELGDRVSWQVLFVELARRYLDGARAA